MAIDKADRAFEELKAGENRVITAGLSLRYRRSTPQELRQWGIEDGDVLHEILRDKTKIDLVMHRKKTLEDE